MNMYNEHPAVSKLHFSSSNSSVFNPSNILPMAVISMVVRAAVLPETFLLLKKKNFFLVLFVSLLFSVEVN